MRLWFTNIYGIMTVGMLAYLSQVQSPYTPYLTGFGAGFSLLGLILSIRICQEQGKYEQKIKDVTKHLHVEEIITPLLAGVEGTKRMKQLGKLLWVRSVFIEFYILMLIVWIALFVLSFS